MTTSAPIQERLQAINSILLELNHHISKDSLPTVTAWLRADVALLGNILGELRALSGPLDSKSDARFEELLKSLQRMLEAKALILNVMSDGVRPSVGALSRPAPQSAPEREL